MNISIDYEIYHEHKIFFDEMAISMQKTGNRVGIVAGLREKDPFNGEDKRVEIDKNLGFKADFVHLWGENEAIASGNLWIAQKLDQEDIYMHFDDDATEIKRYTQRWIVKVMNSAAQAKF